MTGEAAQTGRRRLGPIPLPRLPRLRRRPSARPATAIGRYAHDNWLRRHKKLCFVALTAFAFVYGFAFSILSTVLLVQLTAPILLLAGVLLWVSPDLKRVPERWLPPMFTAFLLGLLCWPDYIAFAAPGLPWLTMIRIIGIPLALVLLVCISCSSDFRRRVMDIFSAGPLISKLLLAFMIVAAFSIGLSNNVFFSINRYVLAVYSWAAVFVVACYVFAQPGRIRRFAYYLWFIAIYCCLIGLYEARYSRLPWAGHIPSFLKIEDERIMMILAGISRAASGIYRVQSKFGISLGLGEFLGMALPFILHIMVTAPRFWVRIAAFVTLPLMFYIVLRTDSRLAFIGFVASILMYGFYWSVMRWLRDRRSIFGPAFTLAYPAVFLGFVTLALVWRRLEVLVFGGGAQQSSTDARRDQYTAGLRIFARNPFGHGIGQGPSTLGYIAPGSDMLTIDTYYLSVALEFGAIGFIIYYAMLLIATWQAGTLALRTRDPELAFVGPACIALINFIISKSVYSQQENHPLMFMILGLVVAALWRERQQNGAAAPAKRRAPRALRMFAGARR